MMAGDVPSGESFTPVESQATAATESPLRLQPANRLTSRETAAIIGWTLLADWLIFRTLGFTGPAVFFAITPLLFVFTKRLRHLDKRVASVVVALLWCVAARLMWSGSGLGIFSGILLVIALAMTASGFVPLVLEALLYLTHVWLSGLLAIAGLDRNTVADREIQDPSDDLAKASWNAPSKGTLVTWGMPVAAVIVFGGIFVFANPDLLSSVWSRCTRVMDFAWSWIEGLSVWEIPFCLLAIVVGAGLLRPVLLVDRFGPEDNADVRGAAEQSPLYAAFRNTLVTLIALFSVYLLFEFATLWGREFPDGFYYAGYAHQGAAWLTFALALATGLLSLVFSGTVLHDSRLGGLRKLAWIWSAQNFLLAAAVYNRLMIYVGYNGMTQMRTIGFFGITLVVIGFVLVLIKIRDQRGFWWLIRAQLIAFMLTVIVYGLFPVDWVAHRYNASRVSSGYLHPSVMIAVKPMDDEGMLPLLDLVDTEDATIREGVRALLARRQKQIESESEKSPWHWTRYQGSTSRLYEQMATNQSKWDRYLKDPSAQQVAIDAYEDYAMQWY